MSPIIEPADYKPLASLPSATVEMTAKRLFSKVTVQLKNTSDKIAFFNELVLKNAEGQAEGFAKWNENYVTLLPGETNHWNVPFPQSATVFLLFSEDGTPKSRRLSYNPFYRTLYSDT